MIVVLSVFDAYASSINLRCIANFNHSLIISFFTVFTSFSFLSVSYQSDCQLNHDIGMTVRQLKRGEIILLSIQNHSVVHSKKKTNENKNAWKRNCRPLIILNSNKHTRPIYQNAIKLFTYRVERRVIFPSCEPDVIQPPQLDFGPCVEHPESRTVKKNLRTTCNPWETRLMEQ